MQKTTHVDIAQEEEFDNLYLINEQLPKDVWQSAFLDVVSQFDSYALSGSFWYIGDFTTGGVVAAGGNLKESTNLKPSDWLGLQPKDIGLMMHPEDRIKMQSYVVHIAGRLASMTDEARAKTKPFFLFRMQNSSKEYTWRMMYYPKLVYTNDFPHYVMCLVSNVLVLSKEMVCTLYLEDRTNGQTTIYYCTDENVELKAMENSICFTPRELEVLNYLAQGLISKEIAVKMKISKNTEENHKKNMFGKLGIRKITELLMYAHNKSLITKRE